MADVVTIVNGREYLLGDIAHVGDLTWQHGWPYGCLEASWSMDLPPDVYPAALMPRPDQDVRVEIWDGPVRVWCGYLIEPDPGETWTLHAVGWYAAFANLLALTAMPVEIPTAVPSVAVAQAIARAGLPIAVGTTLSSTSIAEADETIAANTVLSLLDTYAGQIGQRWMVDADYTLTVAADPTTPTLVLDNGEVLRGSADDSYVTDIYPRYVSSVDGSGNPDGWGLGHVGSTAQPAGRRERAMDLTDLGVLGSAGAANAYAQAELDRNGSRMGYTRGLTVRYGDLVRMGGSPRRLAQVRARTMFRSFNVADASGQVQLGLSADVVIGKTTYRDGESTMNIEPVGLAARTFTDTLRANKPKETFNGDAA